MTQFLPGQSNGRPFQPGQSGNPNGRPRGRPKKIGLLPGDLQKEAARMNKGLQTLFLFANDTHTGKVRLVALLEKAYELAMKGNPNMVEHLLDRGFGKVPLKQELTGRDGGPLSVSIKYNVVNKAVSA